MLTSIVSLLYIFISSKFISNQIVFFVYLAGTDLPDDDYTTVVPPIKQKNDTNRKLPNVPIIIENKENESPLKNGIYINIYIKRERVDFMTEVSAVSP
jgi:hypothetical protein